MGDFGPDRLFKVINTKGETVAKLDVAYDLDDANPAIYSDGLLFFGGKVLNRKGETAFRLSDKITAVYPFCNGHAIFENEDMEYGLINDKGEVVIRPGNYDNAYITDDHVYFLNYDGQTKNLSQVKRSGNCIFEKCRY